MPNELGNVKRKKQTGHFAIPWVKGYFSVFLKMRLTFVVITGILVETF